LATKIRLKRIGRRNKPFYRVVVMDSRKKRDGASIEELGWYNPIAGKSEQDYSLKEARVLYWLNEGAQITDIVHHLFKREGIAHKWHLMKQGLDEASVEKEMQKWALDRTEVEKRRTAKIKLGKKAKAKQKALIEEQKEIKEDIPIEEKSESTEVELTAETPDKEESDSKSEEKDKDITEDEAPKESDEDQPVEETIETVEDAEEEKTPEESPTEKGEKEESAEATDGEEKAEEPEEDSSNDDGGNSVKEEPVDSEPVEPIEKTIVEKKSDKKELKKEEDVSSETGEQEKDTVTEDSSDPKMKNDSDN